MHPSSLNYGAYAGGDTEGGDAEGDAAKGEDHASTELADSPAEYGVPNTQKTSFTR